MGLHFVFKNWLEMVICLSTSFGFSVKKSPSQKLGLFFKPNLKPTFLHLNRDPDQRRARLRSAMRFGLSRHGGHGGRAGPRPQGQGTNPKENMMA